MANKNEYINRVASALQGMEMHGLFPSVTIAQAALESGWGESSLTKNYNNHFGMTKGSGTNYGGFNGQTVTINGHTYRAYPSIEASIADRNGLLLTLNRYKDVPKARTPREQITAIINGGYTQSDTYVGTVMQIIEQNDLTRFDAATTGGGTGAAGTTTQTQKQYKMNTKTLSIIIVAVGLALAAVGGYNLFY